MGHHRLFPKMLQDHSQGVFLGHGVSPGFLGEQAPRGMCRSWRCEGTSGFKGIGTEPREGDVKEGSQPQQPPHTSNLQDLALTISQPPSPLTSKHSGAETQGSLTAPWEEIASDTKSDRSLIKLFRHIFYSWSDSS